MSRSVLISNFLQVVDMVTAVRDQFVENFHGYEWMDEQTADKAVEKARAISKYLLAQYYWY